MEHPQEEGGRDRWRRVWPWLLGALVGMVFLPLLRPLTRYIPEPPPVLGTVAWVALEDEGSVLSEEEWRTLRWVVALESECSCATVWEELDRLLEGARAWDLDAQVWVLLVEGKESQPPGYHHGSPPPAGMRLLRGRDGALEALLPQLFDESDRRKISSQGWTGRVALLDSQGRLRGRYRLDGDDLHEAFFRARRVGTEQQLPSGLGGVR